MSRNSPLGVAGFFDYMWKNPPPPFNPDFDAKRVAMAERYHSRLNAFDDKVFNLGLPEPIQKHLLCDFADLLKTGEFKGLGYALTIRTGLPSLTPEEQSTYAVMKAKHVDTPPPKPNDDLLPARVRMRM